MLPLRIDRALARLPCDGARAVYLHECIARTKQDAADTLAALEYRRRFIEARVRERIKRAEGK